MCIIIDKMEIEIEDLLRINKGFGGNVFRTASLEYAIEKMKSKRIGFYTKLAYLFRAILIDHPFSDGNKRTAMFFAFFFADKSKKTINKDILTHHILSISKNNISDIRNIKRRLITAIR